MAREEKKYHYIYKTTCIVTNRFYIGMHSTNNLDDGYMGSGKRLRYSIKKYGKDNHTKEILEYYNTREKLSIREEEIVNSDLVKESNCMNLVIGGGGFMLDDYHYECSKNGNKIRNEKYKNDPEFREQLSKSLSKGVKKAYKEGRKDKNWGKNWTGLKHSEETKLKMSESSKGQGSGSSNSQYGTCWITNEVENKKIMKGDLIPEGWRLGRKIKK